MQLYMIRHCQSENNAMWAKLGDSTGRVDDPLLTEIGRKQAQLLGRFVATADPDVTLNDHDHHNRRGFGITYLYSSLMVRAIQTGLAIAATTGVPLVGWEEIHETGGIFLGDPESGERNGLPGKDRAFFEMQYPDLVLPDTMNPDGWWNRPFEEKPAIKLRAQTFVRQLWDRHGGTDDCVAIVTHGGFSQAILTQLLGLHYPLYESDLERPVWFRFNNGSISRIDFHEDYAMVAYLNRVDYLSAELIT